MRRLRPLGHGPLRIGTPFSFREDMYSLMFIAFTKPEYKQACDDEEAHAKQED